ncbi:MAG: aldehyde dehydrogenase (NADP(+)), partial [Candidatus Competibacterales bacterium]
TPPRPDVRQYKIPLGPVAVFGASNFPLAFSVAGGDTASALAAGCPVVVRAHPAHPGTAALVGADIQLAVAACGMPPGTFSLLQGRGLAMGRALVQHPAIAAVGFTGSLGGGRAIFDLAAARPQPIPVYAEMGSVNPLFLMPRALEQRVEALAEGFVASLTLGCGQFCTNPGLIFAPAGPALEAWLEAGASRLRQHPAGVMLHGGILQAYGAGQAKVKATAGVSPVAEGQAAPKRAQAGLYRTTVANFLAHPELAEEVFGPAGLVVAVAGPEDYPAVARGLAGQLVAAVHWDAADGDIGPLLSILETRVGRVLLNGFPTGVDVGHAMVHGGPYPATTAAHTTSVGTLAMERFLRPVCYQDVPDPLLPPALQNGNPLGLMRLVDGALTPDPL